MDIAEQLGVAKSTASRWRQKPEHIAAIEAVLSEARSETAGRLTEFTDKALDVIDEMLDYRRDKSLLFVVWNTGRITGYRDRRAWLP